MISTITIAKRQFLLPFSFMLLTFAAQSQNTTQDLEEKMKDLYQQANQLYADLPKRNFQGQYLNMTFGISPFGKIKTWRTENVCDCEGNVVDTKTVEATKSPISFGLAWEKRLNNLFSWRIMGSYAHLSHSTGRPVVAENGSYSEMQQNYTLSQYGLSGSALLHIQGFYGGAGMSYTSTTASGFRTALKKTDMLPPQYYNLKADVMTPQRNDFAPHLFIGYQIMLSPHVLSSLEVGFAQRFYANMQLSFPLSNKTRSSFTDWQLAHKTYKVVHSQAVAIDKKLHPSKFQTDDCSNINNSTNSCPR